MESSILGDVSFCELGNSFTVLFEWNESSWSEKEEEFRLLLSFGSLQGLISCFVCILSTVDW